MSQCNLGEPWRVQMNADIKAAAAEHPEIEMIWKDAQNDTLKQRAHVEELTSAGVDLILVSPKEAAPLTEPVAKAMEAGIPVIVLDREVLGDSYTTFIGADNVAIGRAAGKWLAGALQGKGKIVELEGLMTSTPGQDRHTGFLEGIAGSGLEVAFTADMKWLEPDARRRWSRRWRASPRSTPSTPTTTPARTAPISPRRRRDATRRCSSSASTRCRTRASPT